MLSELQKAIIYRSSIRFLSPEGEIDVLRGRIVNAEKGDTFGLEALVDLLESEDWKMEPLDSTPPVTINEDWISIKDRIFPSKGYSEDFSLFFKDLEFRSDELPRFMDWIRNVRFTGFVVSDNALLAFIDGEPYYTRMVDEGQVYTGSRGFYRFLGSNQKLDVYQASPAVVNIFVSSISASREVDREAVPSIRVGFAREGSSGIIASPERFEVFQDGIRIVNSTDTEFVGKAFPNVGGDRAVVGLAEYEPEPIKVSLLSREDLSILRSVYDRTLEGLRSKVGKELMESIVGRQAPSEEEPDRMIEVLRELLKRAKEIGGKAWIKKHKESLLEDINRIEDAELRKKVLKLFDRV